MRDAYSILDQVSKSDKIITVADINENFGIISKSSINELINDVINGNAQSVIDKMADFSKSSTNYIVVVDKIIEILNEKVRNIKLGNDTGDCILYKNIIFELLKLYNLKNINNPYLILEVTLLNYCNNSQNYFPGNNLKEEKLQEKIQKNDNIVEDEVIEKVPNNVEINNIEVKNNSDNNCSDFVRIRINNTFVEANKKFKQTMIDNYNNFLQKVDNIYKNMLEDSSIEVASDKYAIIVFEHEATANVANSNISNIEEQFSNIINQNMKFVCISKDFWNNVAEEFKNNIKNKVKYEYIEEIEDNSNSVFDTSIVEVI